MIEYGLEGAFPSTIQLDKTNKGWANHICLTLCIGRKGFILPVGILG